MPRARGFVPIAIALFAISLVSAHQDIIIEVAGDGRLQALPKAYQPARLVVPEAEEDAFPPVSLRLGENLVEFPECLSILFHKARKIRLSASWYHDPETLPYYLSISLPTTRVSKYSTYDGWTILVALESAEVLEVRAVFATPSGRGLRSREIQLETFGTPEELAQLHPRKAE